MHYLPRKKSKVDDPVEVSNCALVNETFVPGMLTLLTLLRKLDAEELFITEQENKKIFHHKKQSRSNKISPFTVEKAIQWHSTCQCHVHCKP